MPVTATVSVATNAKMHDRGVLHDQQPGAVHRHGEQVAQGADVGLAGDRVAGDHATASGRNSPSSMVSAASATNRPFSVIERKKSGPSPPAAAWTSLDGDRDEDRHRGEHQQAGLVAPAAEDQPQLGAQEPRRGSASRRAPGRRDVASAADIEALPGQRRRRCPRGVGALDAEAGDRRRPAWTHAATIFSGATSPSRAVARPGRRVHVGEPELAHDPRPPPAGWSVSTRASVCRPPRTSALVPWATSRPTCITPMWRAHLLHLGEQVAGDEHRRAVVGERPDEGAHLAGALRVEAVGGLVEHQQVPRREQGAGDGEPLAHAEGVGAVALAGGGQQARPGRAPRRSRRPAVRRVGRAVGGVEPDAGSRAPRGRGGRPGPRRGHRPGAATSPASLGHRPPEQLDLARRSGRTSPSSIRMVVVLPEPLGPRKP